MKPPYAIGSVPSLSGHAVAYRWRSLPRVRRHRASKPQGSSERVLPWQITMDQLIFASLSHTHYWYEVGMLKVPAEFRVSNVSRWEPVVYFFGVVLDIPPKATTTIAQVGETVVSRCFVGCLGQARKRCSNRCCYSLRNYPSDVRPNDPLPAGVESPSQTLALGVGVVYLYLTFTCTAKILKIKNQPTDRRGSSLVRLVKYLTFLYRILYF